MNCAARTPRKRPTGLEQALLGHRQRCTVRSDDVIDEPHIDELERSFEARGDELVRLGRSNLAARVIVRIMCP